METVNKNLFQKIKEIQDFECPNCQRVALQPLLLNCKHFFCGECFIKNKECVQCKLEWDKNQAIFVQNDLHGKRKVQCLETDCKWTGQLKDFNQHKKEVHQTQIQSEDSSSLKKKLKKVSKENQKLRNKNSELSQKISDFEKLESDLRYQIEFLKTQLYEEKPTILKVQKKVVEYPNSLTFENYKEGLNCESKFKKIVSDFFNPRSSFLKQDFSFQLPFKFSFNVESLQHYQSEVGFVICDKEEPIGKVSISEKAIEVKLNDKKHYNNFNKSLVVQRAKIEFELSTNTGTIYQNREVLKEKIYPNDFFRYGDDYKFYPYCYSHFPTKFERSFIAY